MVEVNDAYQHGWIVCVSCPALKFLPHKTDGWLSITHYTDRHDTHMNQKLVEVNGTMKIWSNSLHVASTIVTVFDVKMFSWLEKRDRLHGSIIMLLTRMNNYDHTHTPECHYLFLKKFFMMLNSWYCSCKKDDRNDSPTAGLLDTSNEIQIHIFNNHTNTNNDPKQKSRREN